MSRPAMLVDIVWPLLSVLESNQDAPMREAITWELQIADSTDDANLRDAYADRLHEWGCAKREADVRKEAKAIRGGKVIPIRRHSPLLGMRYPEGETDCGTDGVPMFRNNHDIARELLDQYIPGALITLPNTPRYDGTGDEWDFIPVPNVRAPEAKRE